MRHNLSRTTAIVFIGGFSSMGLEIVAGRIVTPAFGSSIYTWGSIIGVFLTALSIGYWIGGRRAEDHASQTQLRYLFYAAALYVVLLTLGRETVINSTAAIGLPAQYAALPAIILLFGIPTALIGLISPYAAELIRESGKGAAAGQVYAVGTAGSIIGVFATTFLFIPLFPIETMLFLFGAAFLLAALVLQPSRTGERTAVFLIAALLIITGPSIGIIPGSNVLIGDVIYQTQTPYQELVVKDRNGVRTLYLNGQRQSAMDLSGDRDHVFTYTPYFHIPFLLTNDTNKPMNVLFIGGGGFTGPKHFVETYPNVTVDVVEIDPDVIYTAKQYFNVTESDRLRIHNEDGRAFLRDTDTTYDIIILDAYQKDRVPFHMTTAEFMQLAHTRLDSDGVFMANIISQQEGEAAIFYRSQYRTIQEAFPTVYSFPTRHLNVLQNIELIATKQSRLTTEELLQRNRERDIGINLERQIQMNQPNAPQGEAIILRDDHAPVDDLLKRHVDKPYQPQINTTPVQ